MRSAITIGLLGLITAGSVVAQARPAWVAGARFTERSAGPTAPALWLGGEVEWSRPGWWLSAAGAGGRGWRGRLGGEAALSAGVSARIFRRTSFRASVDGMADHPIGDETVGELAGRGGLLHRWGPVEFGAGALALGRAIDRPVGYGGGYVSTQIELGPLTVRGDLGHLALFTGSLGSPSLGSNNPWEDTLAAGGGGGGAVGGASSPARRLSHAMVGARIRQGRFELSATGLRRSRVELGQSLGWELGLAVGPFNGARLRISGGRMPTGRAIYLPYRKQLAIGLELRHRDTRVTAAESAAAVAAGFELRADPGGARIVVRHPTAARVEIAGDFSDWQPIVLRPAGQRQFETRLWIEPGTHQVNVRFDGGPWVVPPGLGSAPDEFGGRVGVLVVRGSE